MGSRLGRQLKIPSQPNGYGIRHITDILCCIPINTLEPEIVKTILLEL